MTARALPWTELFTAIGEERFVEIRTSLAASGMDVFVRDAFVMNGAVGQLLRETMPDEAPAETVNAYAALIHMTYLAWAAGWPVRTASEAALRAALSDPSPLSHSPALPRISYLQLPPNLVWAEPVAGEPHEPMDGAFVVTAADHVHVLGVLGFRSGRDGFTTMEGAITLPAPTPGPRPDGRAGFASTLPAGERAGLFSVVDEHELAALALLALAPGPAKA
jgi:hypothetical protein